MRRLSTLQTISRNRNFNKVFFILCIIAVATLTYASFYPYLPWEGDTFGCWYPYAQNLWKGGIRGGLRLALSHADAQGRYPGYALILLTIEKLLGLSFLHTLFASRVFALLLSLSGGLFLLRSLGLPLILACGSNILIHLNPAFMFSILTSTQDSFKPGFFFFAAAFLINADKREKRWAWVGFCISSVCLGCLRSVELIPLASFAFFRQIQYALLQPRRLRPATAWCKFALNFTLLMSPAALMVIGLHLYGHRIVGHWGLSAVGGGATETWYHYYLENLRHGSKLLHLVGWPLVVLINKTSYFVQDYFLDPNASQRIIGAYRFVSHIEPGATGWVNLVSYIIAAAGILLLTLALTTDRTLRHPSTPWLWSGVSAIGFYTFGLNHYETRYWSLIFATFAIGFVLRVKSRAWLSGFLAVAIASMTLVAVQNSLDRKRVSDLGQQKSALWLQKVEPICKRQDAAVVVPYGVYVWSAFRFLVNERCPDLLVLFEAEGGRIGPKLPTVGTELLRMPAADF